MGFSFFSLLLCSFRDLATIPIMLLCYSCRGVKWPQLARPLLGFLRILLLIGYNDPVWSLDLYSCYFRLSWPITLLVGSFVPFLSSLGILGSFSNFALPWTFTNSFGLLDPITLPFIHGAHGLSINPLLSYFITSRLLWSILTFLHHIMPMSLLLLSLGSFRPICFPQDQFIYLMDLWSIIPTIRA